MASVNVEEWLDEWEDEHLTETGYVEDKAAMSADAQACMAHAQAAGISAADLKAVTGADLEAYLMRRRNAATDAEVNRLVAKDD